MRRTAEAAGGGGMIRTDDRITIDEAEISESFTRSSGPGGQKVNKPVFPK